MGYSNLIVKIFIEFSSTEALFNSIEKSCYLACFHNGRQIIYSVLIYRLMIYLLFFLSFSFSRFFFSTWIPFSLLQISSFLRLLSSFFIETTWADQDSFSIWQHYPLFFVIISAFNSFACKIFYHCYHSIVFIFFFSNILSSLSFSF